MLSFSFPKNFSFPNGNFSSFKYSKTILAPFAWSRDPLLKIPASHQLSQPITVENCQTIDWCAGQTNNCPSNFDDFGQNNYLQRSRTKVHQEITAESSILSNFASTFHSCFDSKCRDVFVSTVCIRVRTIKL